MDWTIIALLFFSGVAGGIINALAGGATLITFPVMLAAGLAPVTANASNAVAITIFIIQDAVKWQETFIMLAGALPGGYAGGLLIRVLPAHIVRWCVIAAGMLMSLIYAQRYWC